MAELSPATKAILEIVNAAPHCGSGRIKVAAALRAAAHHLQRRSPWPNDVEGIGIDWSTSELHDIAAELEGQ
jgi:hypothetical protein